MKLADSSPFSVAAKRFNSEELQKAHQEQIIKLESLLDEQTKIAKILVSFILKINFFLTKRFIGKRKNVFRGGFA